MANQVMQVKLNILGDAKQAKQEVASLKQNLQQTVAIGNQLKFSGTFTSSIAAASGAAQQLQVHLSNALTGSTLDINKFNASLKASGQNVTGLARQLVQAGSSGSQAFLQLSRQIISAQAPMKATNVLLQKMGTTLMNTIRWQISSSMLMGFTSAVRGAFTYVKDLNKELNNIRIVTGYTKEEVDRLGKAANKMARELKTSTLEVVKGQLIFQQQGDNMALSAKKAELTIKATATAMGASAQEMSNYLTAVWNSYRVGEEHLESFIDKANALGAKTAVTQQEIFTAMEKSAAAAHAVGVEYDQLGATIATIGSVTRNSAETIGTALKTIYARIGDLKINGPDEDGIGLGQISSQLKTMGIEILDAQNNLRNMGDVIEEVGSKYQGWTKAQQAAVVQAIAGKRQYTQLTALFENWDMYQRSLSISKTADGELDRQYNIAIESMEGATKRFKAETEGIYQNLLDDDALIAIVNRFSDIISVIGKTIDGIGGMGPVLMLMAGIFSTKFVMPIVNGIHTIRTNFGFLTGQTMTEHVSAVRSLGAIAAQTAANSNLISASTKIEYQNMAMVADLEAKRLENERLLTSTQKQKYQNALLELDALKQISIEISKQKEESGRQVAQTKQNVLNAAKNRSPEQRQEEEHRRSLLEREKFMLQEANTTDQGKEQFYRNIAVTTRKPGQAKRATEKAKNLQSDIDARNTRLSEIEQEMQIDNSSLLENEMSSFEKDTRKNFFMQDSNSSFGALAKKRQVLSGGDLARQAQAMAGAGVSAQSGGQIEAMLQPVNNLKNALQEVATFPVGVNAEDAIVDLTQLDTKSKEFKRALETLNIKPDSQGHITKLVQELQKAEVNCDDLDNETFDKLQKEIDETGNKVQTNLNDKFKGTQNNIEKTLKQNNLSDEEVQQYVNDVTEDSKYGASEDLADARRKETKVKAKLTLDPDSLVSGMEKVTTAVSQVSSAMMGLSMMWNTIKDPDASGWQKFSSVLMGVSMVLPVVTSLLTLFTAAKKADELQTKKNIKQNIIEAGTAIAKAFGYATENTTLTFGAAAGLLAVAAAGAAVVAALVGGAIAVGAGAINAKKEQSPKGQHEAALKKEKEAADGLKNVTEEYDKLKSSLDDYHDLRTGLDSLIEGTDEWNEKLQESNAKVLELMKNYPQLAAKGAIIRDANGALTITKEGEETLLSEQEKAISDATYRSVVAQKDVLKTDLNVELSSSMEEFNKNHEIKQSDDIVGSTASNYSGRVIYEDSTLDSKDMDAFVKVIEDYGSAIWATQEKLKEALTAAGIHEIEAEAILEDPNGIFKELTTKIETTNAQLKILNGEEAKALVENTDKYKNADSFTQAAMKAAAEDAVENDLVDNKVKFWIKNENKEQSGANAKSKDEIGEILTSGYNNTNTNKQYIKDYLKWKSQQDGVTYELVDDSWKDGWNWFDDEDITIQMTDKEGKKTNVDLNLSETDDSNNIDLGKFLAGPVKEWLWDTKVQEEGAKRGTQDNSINTQKERANNAYDSVFGGINGLNATDIKASYLNNNGTFNFDGLLTAKQYDRVYENIVNSDTLSEQEKTKYLNALKQASLKIDDMGNSSAEASEQMLKASKSFEKVSKTLSDEIFKEGKVSFNTLEEVRKSLRENGFQNADKYVDNLYAANLEEDSRAALLKAQSDMFADMLNEQIAEGFFENKTDGAIIAYLKTLGIDDSVLPELFKKIKMLSINLDELLSNTEIKKITDKFDFTNDFDTFKTAMADVTEKFGLNSLELIRLYEKLKMLEINPNFDYDGYQAALAKGDVKTVDSQLSSMKLSDFRKSLTIYDENGNQIDASTTSGETLDKLITDYFGDRVSKTKDGQWHLDGENVKWRTLLAMYASASVNNKIKSFGEDFNIDSSDIVLKQLKELNKQLDETLDKHRLEKLKEVIEKIAKEIEKIKKDISTIDWGIENADPSDYALKIELYNKKMNKSIQYVKALKSEFNRLEQEYYKAETAEEKQAIADRMEEINDEIMSNTYAASEAYNEAIRLQFEQVAEYISNVATIAEATSNYLDDINKINQEEYQYGRNAFSSIKRANAMMKSLLEISKATYGDSEAVKAKKEESKRLIKEQEERDEKIYKLSSDALEKMHEKNQEERDEELEKIQKHTDSVYQTYKTMVEDIDNLPDPEIVVTTVYRTVNETADDTGFFYESPFANHVGTSLSEFKSGGGPAFGSGKSKITPVAAGQGVTSGPGVQVVENGIDMFKLTESTMVVGTGPDQDYYYGRHFGQDYYSNNKNYSYISEAKNKEEWGEYDPTAPVYTFEGGVIKKVVWDTKSLDKSGPGAGFGNHIRIQTADGSYHIYAHFPYKTLMQFAGRVGDYIGPLTFLGYQGSTGVSSRPHLHFEVRNKDSLWKSSPKATANYLSKMRNAADGAEVTGPQSVFVGEEGAELVIWKSADGVWNTSLVGTGGLEKIDFQAGEEAYILDANETKRIINQPRYLKDHFQKDDNGNIASTFTIGNSGLAGLLNDPSATDADIVSAFDRTIGEGQTKAYAMKATEHTKNGSFTKTFIADRSNELLEIGKIEDGEQRAKAYKDFYLKWEPVFAEIATGLDASTESGSHFAYLLRSIPGITDEAIEAFEGTNNSMVDLSNGVAELGLNVRKSAETDYEAWYDNEVANLDANRTNEKNRGTWTEAKEEQYWEDRQKLADDRYLFYFGEDGHENSENNLIDPNSADGREVILDQSGIAKELNDIFVKSTEHAQDVKNWTLGVGNEIYDVLLDPTLQENAPEQGNRIIDIAKSKEEEGAQLIGELQSDNLKLKEKLATLEPGSELYNQVLEQINTNNEQTLKITEAVEGWKKQGYDLIKGQTDYNQQIADSTTAVLDNLGLGNVFRDITATSEKLVEAKKRTAAAAKAFGTDSLEYREALEAETALIAEQKDQYLSLAETLKDFSISKLQGEKNNLNKVQEITKSIRQEQHELNKELQNSLTNYQYLDAETRKLLFNEEDYLKLNQKLNDIQTETNRLSAEYLEKLEKETDPEKLEILNNEYQRKYELQMKSYEIAKQELEVEKKKAALVNTLNERNTQMFINGQWTWVADTDAVIQAQNALSDAQHGLDEAQFDLSDTRAMQKLDAEIDKINGAFDDLKETIKGKDGVEEALELMGKTAYNIYEEFSKILEDEKHGGVTTFEKANSSSYYSGTHTQIDATDASGRNWAAKKLSNGSYVAVDRVTGQEFNIRSLTKEGLKHAMEGYATGTSSAKSGLARVIEQGSELLATKEGFLYEMSGGEMVFNNDQFRFLYEFSKTPVNKMLNGLAHNDNSSVDNSITINGISIDAKSQEGEALKDILTRILGNR